MYVYLKLSHALVFISSKSTQKIGGGEEEKRRKKTERTKREMLYCTSALHHSYSTTILSFLLYKYRPTDRVVALSLSSFYLIFQYDYHSSNIITTPPFSIHRLKSISIHPTIIMIYSISRRISILLPQIDTINGFGRQ